MAVQIRVIGSPYEVDQALARIGTVVELNTGRMTRTSQGLVGRALTSLEGKVADILGVPSADDVLAVGPVRDEVVHVTAETPSR